MRELCFVDIFSGAGGSALGFVQAGFKPVGALDIDKNAAKTFEYNFKLKPLVKDAKKFDFKKWVKELGDIHVLVGCPPCQGFSRMKRNGDKDPRNDLIYVYLNAVRTLKPEVAVFENVSGMVRALNGEYLKLFLSKMEKMRFKIVWGVLNAADYGVPQRRKRIIIIASKKTVPELPEPTHGNPKDKKVKKGLLKPWRTVRDAIYDLRARSFRVLVAEIMLQRTRADQVESIFRKFFEEFPDIESAAKADKEKMVQILEPLGLRHRIPRIRQLLSELVEKYDGRVPDKYETLLKLPGVGPYIASAVLCFGFGIAVPIVDSNIARFYMRFFGLKRGKKRPHQDERVLKLARKYLPKNRAKEFTEALLDFTALVCKPNPLCDSCPLKEKCQYYLKRRPSRSERP